MMTPKVLVRQNIGATASYYSDGADDYYGKEGDAMEWQGEGAKDLGLEGTVEKERFKELLAGQIKPGQEIRQDTRKDSKARIGIDLTFSAPKSVSMQALVHGDVEIIKAHDRAVAKAVELAEQRAQARKKTKGKTEVENTGNLVVAKFRHETSRERDPQLHTHAIVLNMTKRSDGQWRALRNDEILKVSKYLGAAYRAELAMELSKLGYSIRHERDGLFELAHISRDQLEKFSQRSAQIEQRLADQGLTRATASAEQKQAAALQSRAPKVNIDREVLFKEWVGRAKELQIDFQRRDYNGDNLQHKASERAPGRALEDMAADRAVKYAIHHLTERQAVVSESALIDTALKHGIGTTNMDGVEAAVRAQLASGYLIKAKPAYQAADAVPGTGQSQTREAWITELERSGVPAATAKERVDTAINKGSLVESEPRYTTQTAVEREKRILSIERDGRGAVAQIAPVEATRAVLEQSTLNAGQRQSAELIATSQNRVIGVQGFAGTGKSHMLDTAKQIVEGEGYTVQALAPYGSQVKALRELGVEAKTVASFLKAKDKVIDARTVIVIDEAGTVPTRQMDQLLKLAEKSGARVVLMGDTAQTKAIEAGRPFDQLQAAGMQTGKMEDIQRQKDPDLKEAVMLSARGHAAESLKKISQISEIEDKHERRNEVAQSYLKLAPSEREKTIIVSGTNEARREINALIREGTGTAGKGIEFNTLIRFDTTQAERRHAKYFRVGDAIQPEVDYKISGLKRGELYQIKDNGPGNRLTVENAAGERFSINPGQHTKLSVYQQERAELSVGDKVRITRNDAALDVANGDRFTVEAVSAEKVTLRSETRTVELDATKPLHLDYAHVSTVHSSQGLTADRVIFDADTKSLTTAKDVYYVAISRARHEARIFTDDRSKLPKAISRENVKHAALDLAYKRHKGKQHETEKNGKDLHSQEKGRSTEKGRTNGDRTNVADRQDHRSTVRGKERG